MKHYLYKGKIITADSKEEAKKIVAKKSIKVSKLPENISNDLDYLIKAINSNPLFTKVEVEEYEEPQLLFDTEDGIEVEINEDDVYHCMEFTVGPYVSSKKWKWEVYPQPRGIAIWPELVAHHFNNVKDAYNYCVLCAKEYSKCIKAYTKFKSTIDEVTAKLK